MEPADRLEFTDEMLSLFDEEEGDVEFHLLARITLGGQPCAVFADPDDEEGLMIFSITIDPDGIETFNPVEDEDESEKVFYLYEAAFDDYSFGQAI